LEAKTRSSKPKLTDHRAKGDSPHREVARSQNKYAMRERQMDKIESKNDSKRQHSRKRLSANFNLVATNPA
jgi:hypothetical protein